MKAAAVTPASFNKACRMLPREYLPSGREQMSADSIWDITLQHGTAQIINHILK